MLKLLNLKARVRLNEARGVCGSKAAKEAKRRERRGGEMRPVHEQGRERKRKKKERDKVADVVFGVHRYGTRGYVKRQWLKVDGIR